MLLPLYILGPTVKSHLASLAAGCLGAGAIAMYTSQLILLLLSAITSAINTSDLVPLAAIYVHTIASTMFDG